MHLRAFVYMCSCLYETANHRLIGAISALAEQHNIAAPDGQLEVDGMDMHIKHIHTHLIHTCSMIYCTWTHGGR